MPELLGVNDDGSFTVATAKITIDDLQSELNQAIANYGQVEERTRGELASAQARLDEAQKNYDIASSVINDKVEFAEAKAGISVKPSPVEKIEP